MTRELTYKDIKEIKYEKRFGIIFSCIIIAFGLLFSLNYFLDHNKNINWFNICLINICICILSFGIQFIMNRKYYKDLKSRNKNVIVERVDRKERSITYEAGSGMLNRPILGYLFPKLWKQEMKSKNRFDLIIKNTRYEIDEQLYEKINNGDTVEMHYTIFSKMLLNIEL